VDISFTVFCVCVCTVTDFSGEDKASGVKFCTVVHQRPGQGMSYFWELCSPEAQNRTNRPAAGKQSLRGTSFPTVNVTLQMRRSWNIARRVDVGSACVDIRSSPKTDVLVGTVSKTIHGGDI